VRVSRVFAVLIFVPCVALAADAVSLHKKAKARMKSLDFDAALPLLEQLRGDPTLPAAQKADVLVDLGVTHVNLGATEEARNDFKEALRLDEHAHPPASTSPKVQRVFEGAREALDQELHPPVPPPPPPEPMSVAPPPEPAPKPVPAPPEIHVVVKPRLKLVPAVLGVVGLGSIAAGVVLALQSQGVARQEQSALHPAASVQAYEGQRNAMGTAAYVTYGLGAALLVTAIALFLFSGGEERT
jgi:hypothetical protein